MVKIEGVPQQAFVGEYLDLSSAYALPDNAFYQTVQFNIYDNGGTGCKLHDGYRLYTGNTPGIIQINAIVVNGKGKGDGGLRNFVETKVIRVDNTSPVTGNINLPAMDIPTVGDKKSDYSYNETYESLVTKLKSSYIAVNGKNISSYHEFSKENKYQLVVTLLAKDKYRFPESYDLNLIKLGNIKAEKYESTKEGDCAYVYFPITPKDPAPVDEITITGLILPKLGKPVKDLDYSADIVEPYSSVTKIEYYEFLFGKEIDLGEVIEPDKDITIRLTVQNNKNYPFSENCNFTLNGMPLRNLSDELKALGIKDVGFVAIPPLEYRIYITYKPKEISSLIPLENVGVKVDEIYEGNKIPKVYINEYTSGAKQKFSSNYGIEKVEWKCNGKAIDSDSIVEAEKNYSVYITLEPNLGYSLKNSTVKVNDEIFSPETQTDDKIVLKYDFKPVSHSLIYEKKVLASLVNDGQNEGCHCSICGYSTMVSIPKVSTLKLTKTEVSYNGKNQKPSITISDASGRTLTKDTDYTISYPSKSKDIGTYKVTVKGIGDYSFSKSLSFKVNPKGTSISKLIKGKKCITVKWKKLSTKMSKNRITGYQIRYSTKSSMSSAKTVTVKKYSTVSKKITKLKPKKKYYVQIRTYMTVKGKKYYSEWSKAKNIKTN